MSMYDIFDDVFEQCGLHDAHHQAPIVAGKHGGDAPEPFEDELVEGPLLVQALDVGVLRLQAQNLSQALASLMQLHIHRQQLPALKDGVRFQHGKTDGWRWADSIRFGVCRAAVTTDTIPLRERSDRMVCNSCACPEQQNAP